MSCTQMGPNFEHHLTCLLHEIFNLKVFQKLETALWQVVVDFSLFGFLIFLYL